MRFTSAIVADGLLTSAACESQAEPERCAGLIREGALLVVIGPRPGVSGYGESVFVGDTLPSAEMLRPWMRRSTSEPAAAPP